MLNENKMSDGDEGARRSELKCESHLKVAVQQSAVRAIALLGLSIAPVIVDGIRSSIRTGRE